MTKAGKYLRNYEWSLALTLKPERFAKAWDFFMTSDLVKVATFLYFN